MSIMSSIFEVCPNFESARFQLRLVSLEDSWDLLECYSDKKSIELFNSDNCTSDFEFNNIKEMHDSISLWLREYNEKKYIRFSIFDFLSHKVIGTTEIFRKDFENKKIGVLRLDLKSEFEKNQYLNELFQLIDKSFKDIFNYNSLITKSVPHATERIKTLTSQSFEKLEKNDIMPYEHYYIKHY